MTITSHGPLITGSDYWQSELAERGLLYLSVNAGCFRLLIPQSQREAISEMRPGAKHVVISILQPDKWRERESKMALIRPGK